MLKTKKTYWTLTLLVTMSAGLSACSLLHRSSGSGYAYRDSEYGSSQDLNLSYREDRTAFMREQAANEIGIEVQRHLPKGKKMP